MNLQRHPSATTHLISLVIPHPSIAHHSTLSLSCVPPEMSSAEYAPVTRGALKLKGVSQASKPHRKKKAKPEPSLAAHQDSKDGDREKTEDDNLKRQNKSPSRDGEDEERDDGKGEERGDGDEGGDREGEKDPKEQGDIMVTRGKTAAEMRHEERRKRKVRFPNLHSGQTRIFHLFLPCTTTHSSPLPLISSPRKSS